jgi:hypothetical protein
MADEPLATIPISSPCHRRGLRGQRHDAVPFGLEQDDLRVDWAHRCRSPWQARPIPGRNPDTGSSLTPLAAGQTEEPHSWLSRSKIPFRAARSGFTSAPDDEFDQATEAGSRATEQFSRLRVSPDRGARRVPSQWRPVLARRQSSWADCATRRPGRDRTRRTQLPVLVRIAQKSGATPDPSSGHDFVTTNGLSLALRPGTGCLLSKPPACALA